MWKALSQPAKIIIPLFIGLCFPWMSRASFMVRWLLVIMLLNACLGIKFSGLKIRLYHWYLLAANLVIGVLAWLIACWFCGQYFNSDYDCCPYCGSYPGGGNFYGEIMSDQYNELMQGATLITCWSCGQAYNSDYDTCPYCGNYPQSGPTWVDEVDSNQVREAIQGADMIQCANCGQLFNYDYDACPYCGWAP